SDHHGSSVPGGPAPHVVKDPALDHFPHQVQGKPERGKSPERKQATRVFHPTPSSVPGTLPLKSHQPHSAFPEYLYSPRAAADPKVWVRCPFASTGVRRDT